MKSVLDTPYPLLFSPIELGGVSVRNRIAHASIQTSLIRDGRPLPELINYYGSRARGGAGMIVTEPLAMTSLNHSPVRLRAWDDKAIDSLKLAVEVVEAADSRLLGQIQDSGRGRHTLGRSDDAVSASALPDDLSWTVPRALSAWEIEDLISQWASASLRLKNAGFSGVEISAGHGHLFHQFLSPWSNHRDDIYGGDVNGRSKFVCDLVKEIRRSCGYPFIIGIKLPGIDGVPESIDFSEAKSIANVVGAVAELDYWTWAWGAHGPSLYLHLPDAHDTRHPYLDQIRELRQANPAIATGGLGYITDPNECEAALSNGTADIVFLGRALITDAAFGNKAANGREADIRYCVSCNTCWRTNVEAHRIECDNNPRLGEPYEEVWKPEPSKKPRRIAVIGAGIAGMEFAHTAASHGHQVTVFCASHEPGGKTRLHAQLPGGENLSSIYDYQLLASHKTGVDFRFSVHASAKDITEIDPDLVVLATGSTPSLPSFVPKSYADQDVIQDLRRFIYGMLTRTRREVGRVVLYDQDHTEMTYAAAEVLMERFEAVSIVTPRDSIAGDMSLINRQRTYKRLYELGVSLHTSVTIENLDALEDSTVELVNVYNGTRHRLEQVVALTYATPREPNIALLPEIEQLGLAVIRVGDCRAPRSVLAATRDAYAVARSL